jgi:polysaccharide biosynthesis transport protein
LAFVTQEDGASPSTHSDPPLSAAMRSVLSVFRRRIIAFIAVAVLVMAATVAATLLIEPEYIAQTRIKIDPTRSATTGVQADRPIDPAEAIIDTEVSVLKSRDLAIAVTRALRLQYEPQLTEGMARLDPASPLTPAAAADRIDKVAGRLLGKLEVEREPSTYVMDITFQSPDPQIAARVANGFADGYINSSVGARTSTAAKQAGELEKRLAALGSEVRAADAQIAQYRSAAGIIEGGSNGTITDQQIGPLSAQLATAESMAAEARSNLAAARAQIASGELENVSGVLNSNVVSNLRSQRADVVRNMGEVSTRYGPRHPESVRVQQQLDSIDRQIKEEATRVTESLRAQALAADARANSLRTTLNQVRGEQATNTRASVTAESLEREVEAKRAAYNKLAEAVQQVHQQARNSTPLAEVVELAIPPSRPAYPNTKLLLAAGFILALVLATAFIAIQELLAAGFRTAGDVEGRLGVPLVAAIPRLSGAELKTVGKGRAADLLVTKQTSFYAEAYRNVRSTLLLAREGAPRVISVISALPGEGKSTSAISLARVFALSGDRVLLIDGDLRRAGLRVYLNAEVPVGIAQVLTENLDPAKAIVADAIEGLSILPAAEPLFTSEDLFTGDRMKRLLDWARANFDRVIIDTPPTLGISDSRVLAASADAVVLVIKWNSTPVEAVESAVSALTLDRTKVNGAILTMVNRSADALGAGYYSRQYEAYYKK